LSNVLVGHQALTMKMPSRSRNLKHKKYYI
jgi:hypothetical protein